MPATETPPKTTGTPPPPGPREAPEPLRPEPLKLEPLKPEPIKVVTRRYGELDHSELVHLLDSLEGDQAKSRFRESIYISIIFYLAVAWFLVYGPRYLFHQGRIVDSAATIREKNRVAELEMQKDLAKELSKPKVPKVVPKLDRRAIDQLQAMQRANEVARAAPPAPAPSPAPQPAPAPAAPAVQAQAAPPAPLPSAPTPQPLPRPPQPSQIPDAPRPSFTPPPQNPGQSIADAGRAAAQQRTGGARGEGTGARVGQQGAGTGVEILSDTQGVDFTDYIKHLLRMIKAAWLPLIPEECYPPLSKEGSTLIRFSIAKNGQLTEPMTLDASTHDRAIDKAAWGAITGVGVFPPLPAAYRGATLELRIQFIISRNAPDTDY